MMAVANTAALATAAVATAASIVAAATVLNIVAAAAAGEAAIAVAEAAAAEGASAEALAVAAAIVIEDSQLAGSKLQDYSIAGSRQHLVFRAFPVGCTSCLPRSGNRIKPRARSAATQPWVTETR